MARCWNFALIAVCSAYLSLGPVGAASEEGAAQPGVGITRLFEDLKKENPGDVESFYRALLEALSSPTEAGTDRYGQLVNPVSLMPSYAVGIRQALDMAIDQQAVIRRVYGNTELERIFQKVANKYYMADEILTKYRIFSSTNTVEAQERDQLISRVAELWNSAEQYLNTYFGTATIKPGHKDGIVLAKEAFSEIDELLKDRRIREAAQKIWEATRDEASVYHDISLDEIEASIRRLALTPEAEGQAQLQRFRKSLDERQALQAAIDRYADFWPIDPGLYRRQGGGAGLPPAASDPNLDQSQGGTGYEYGPFIPREN